MLKGRFFWLFIVLLLVFWGGYRLYSGKDVTAPGDGQERVVKEEKGLHDLTEGREIVDAELKLQYLGHAAFLMQVGESQFLMDPYDPNCGYGKLDVDADYITISHEHMDHNYIAAAPSAKAIRGLSPDGLGWEEVSLTLGGVEIYTMATYHDDAAGKLRGRNAIFIFNTGDLRLVHLGDLGHMLSPEQVEKLLPVDVLLIPVGGHFTVDGSEALEIIDALQPALVIPMHHRTAATRNWPIAPLEDFLKVVGEGIGQEQKNSVVTISRDTLPQEMEIWIMKAAEPA